MGANGAERLTEAKQERLRCDNSKWAPVQRPFEDFDALCGVELEGDMSHEGSNGSVNNEAHCTQTDLP